MPMRIIAAIMAAISFTTSASAPLSVGWFPAAPQAEASVFGALAARSARKGSVSPSKRSWSSRILFRNSS